MLCLSSESRVPRATVVPYQGRKTGRFDAISSVKSVISLLDPTVAPLGTSTTHQGRLWINDPQAKTRARLYILATPALMHQFLTHDGPIVVYEPLNSRLWRHMGAADHLRRWKVQQLKLSPCSLHLNPIPGPCSMLINFPSSRPSEDKKA